MKRFRSFVALLLVIMSVVSAMDTGTMVVRADAGIPDKKIRVNLQQPGGYQVEGAIFKLLKRVDGEFVSLATSYSTVGDAGYYDFGLYLRDFEVVDGYREFWIEQVSAPDDGFTFYARRYHNFRIDENGVIERRENGAWFVDNTSSMTNSSFVLFIENEYNRGELRVIRGGTYSEIRDNSNYTLTDSVMGVYCDAECRDIDWMMDITMGTDPNVSETVLVPIGMVYLKEKIPGSGFLPDTRVYDTGVAKLGLAQVMTLSDYCKPKVNIHKLSTIDSTMSNSNYSVSGIQFGIYSNESCSDDTLVHTLTVQGEDGYTDSVELFLDKYYIKELDTDGDGTVGTMYKADSTVHMLDLTTIDYRSHSVPQYNASTVAIPYSFNIENDPYTNKFQMYKVSNDTNITNGNPYYSVNGTEYKVYTSYDGVSEVSGEIASLVVGEDGFSNVVGLPLGTYYVKEYKNTKSYKLDDTVYEVDLSTLQYEVQPYVLSVGDDPEKSRVRVVKSSTDSSIYGNDCYSLENAEYGVYLDESCTIKVDILITGANGESNYSSYLPLGKYYIREDKSPKGYLLDTLVHEVELVDGNDYTLSVSDEPYTNDVDLLLYKVDSSTGLKEPEGDGVFEDAEFKVDYFDILLDTNENPIDLGYLAKRSWVFKTDSNGECYLSDEYFVSGDELYYNNQGDVVLPYGTIIINEVKAPNGYRLSDLEFMFKLDGKEYEVFEVLEESIDFKLHKIDAYTGDSLEGVKFSYTNSNGVEVILESNEYGMVRFNGLCEGNHVLKEVKALEGYSLNGFKVDFSVLDNGTIVINDINNDGNAMVIPDADGNLSIVLKNSKIQEPVIPIVDEPEKPVKEVPSNPEPKVEEPEKPVVDEPKKPEPRVVEPEKPVKEVPSNTEPKVDEPKKPEPRVIEPEKPVVDEPKKPEPRVGEPEKPSENREENWVVTEHKEQPVITEVVVDSPKTDDVDTSFYVVPLLMSVLGLVIIRYNENKKDN